MSTQYSKAYRRNSSVVHIRNGDEFDSLCKRRLIDGGTPTTPEEIIAEIPRQSNEWHFCISCLSQMTAMSPDKLTPTLNR